MSRSSWAAVYLSEQWELREPPAPFHMGKHVGRRVGSVHHCFALLTGEGLGPCSMSVHYRPLASWLVTLVHRCLWPVSDLIGWISELEILLKSSTGVIFLTCCPLPYKFRPLLRMHPGLAFHSFFPAYPPQTARVLAEANSTVALWVSAPLHMLFPASDGRLAFPNVDSQEVLLSLPLHMLLPSPYELRSLCCLCRGTDF